MRIAVLALSAFAALLPCEGVQAHKLFLHNGQVIEGEVVEQTPEGVTFHGKIAGIWGRTFFERARVERVEREPGDQGPASDKPAAPRTDPASEKPPSSSRMPASPRGEPKPPAAARPAQDAPDAASAAAEVVEVKVCGEGATPSEAFDDAVRVALRQVAGAFVRDDTRVENDRVVQDRIIAHSQGFIERATKVGSARLEGAVYRQDAVVAVRRGKVAEVLGAPASADGRFDGNTLSARIKAMQDQSASAQELMKAVFEA